jgi:hypothetical protein
MRVLTGIFGTFLLAIILADAIQTVVVARHALRMPHITRLLYRASWAPYAAIARLMRVGPGRERYLGGCAHRRRFPAAAMPFQDGTPAVQRSGPAVRHALGRSRGGPSRPHFGRTIFKLAGDVRALRPFARGLLHDAAPSLAPERKRIRKLANRLVGNLDWTHCRWWLRRFRRAPGVASFTRSLASRSAARPRHGRGWPHRSPIRPSLGGRSIWPRST